jgi:hypothetical protein
MSDDGSADAELPEEVRRFLREHIESFEQLEIVLLLRSRPDQSLHGSAISTELRLPEAIVEEALHTLSQRELVARAPGAEGPLFSYSPETPALAALVSTLAQLNLERRLDVMRSMTANSIERLRARALSRFADAFLLRRGKRKDG